MNLLLLLSTVLLAQGKPFDPVTDDPKLPRVLLLGDSISIGYTLAVRQEMKGEANVHRARQNCGPTTRGLENLEKWLGSGKWDVIHFNFGLHDLKYVDENGKAVSAEKGKYQVPPDAYGKNLGTMVARLKKTGAKLIWCATTPVPEGTSIRVADDAEKYNAVALEVMKRHDIPVNDLHAFAKERLKEIQRPANVHFSPAGSKVLAGEVVRHLRKALGR